MPRLLAPRDAAALVVENSASVGLGRCQAGARGHLYLASRRQRHGRAAGRRRHLSSLKRTQLLAGGSRYMSMDMWMNVARTHLWTAALAYASGRRAPRRDNALDRR
jgi:hypothetical protein